MSVSPAASPQPRQGWVAPHLAEEFPGLGIASIELEVRFGRSPEPVRARLRALADRIYGAQVVQARERPIPWAYRVFFRQIGLDPDSARTPIEQLLLDRIRDGGMKSAGLPADALTVAIAETGVALRAFDAERLAGRLCIRDTAPGESLAAAADPLPQGTLVIADEREPAGLLFGATAAGREAGAVSSRVAIAAVQVKGVPQIAVNEALQIAADTLAA